MVRRRTWQTSKKVHPEPASPPPEAAYSFDAVTGKCSACGHMFFSGEHDMTCLGLTEAIGLADSDRKETEAYD